MSLFTAPLELPLKYLSAAVKLCQPDCKKLFSLLFLSVLAFLVVVKLFCLSVISGIVVLPLTVLLSSEISRRTQSTEETEKS